MATYHELVAQKAAIDAQIEEARKAELATAVGEVKRLVGEYGLTAADCGLRIRRPGKEYEAQSAGQVPRAER